MADIVTVTDLKIAGTPNHRVVINSNREASFTKLAVGGDGMANMPGTIIQAEDGIATTLWLDNVVAGNRGSSIAFAKSGTARGNIGTYGIIVGNNTDNNMGYFAGAGLGHKFNVNGESSPALHLNQDRFALFNGAGAWAPISVRTLGTETGDYQNLAASFRSTGASYPVTLQLSNSVAAAHIQWNGNLIEFDKGARAPYFRTGAGSLDVPHNTHTVLFGLGPFDGVYIVWAGVDGGAGRAGALITVSPSGAATIDNFGNVSLSFSLDGSNVRLLQQDGINRWVLWSYTLIR